MLIAEHLAKAETRGVVDAGVVSSAFEVTISSPESGEAGRGLNNGQNERIFTLHGKGWGHGVGLCQIGAAVMGEAGKTYDEILLFYYRHAEISKLYE